MNRSYTENSDFRSDFGIYEAFYTEVVAPTKKHQKIAETFLYRCMLLLQLLCSATAKRLARVLVVTLCLVGTIGVAGAMETGNISLQGGLLLCALLLCIEFFCLRGKPQKQQK